MPALRPSISEYQRRNTSKRCALRVLPRNKAATGPAVVALLLRPRAIALDGQATTWHQRGTMDATDDQPARPEKVNPPPPHVPAWQSTLNPHLETIWAARRAGKTYRAIAADLEAVGVRVAPSTIMRFVRARARRAAQIALPDLPGKEAPKPARLAPQPAPIARPQDPVKEQGRGTAPVVVNGQIVPQTTSTGLSLPDTQEAIATDRRGAPITRNKPMRGAI